MCGKYVKYLLGFLQVLRSYVAALAPLAGALEGREARGALAAAFGALAAGPLPALQQTAELVAGMTAMSVSAVSRIFFLCTTAAGRLCSAGSRSAL
jgi:hypothetical protein